MRPADILLRRDQTSEGHLPHANEAKSVASGHQHILTDHTGVAKALLSTDRRLEGRTAWNQMGLQLKVYHELRRKTMCTMGSETRSGHVGLEKGVRYSGQKTKMQLLQVRRKSIGGKQQPVPLP